MCISCNSLLLKNQQIFSKRQNILTAKVYTSKYYSVYLLTINKYSYFAKTVAIFLRKLF